jgi:HK97 family phage major capsid protein/HK97 family phage prohead protease
MIIKKERQGLKLKLNINRIKEELNKLRVLDLNIRKRELEEEPMILEGYAITFNSPATHKFYDIEITEIIDKNALDFTNMENVPLRYNHNSENPVLASTRNGSLELIRDGFGLKIIATLLDTQSNRDFYKSVEAGLINKMSFAFTIAEGGEEFKEVEPNKYLRTIKSIDKLYDVSIVDTPYYESTMLIARDLENLDNKNIKKNRREKIMNLEDINKRRLEIMEEFKRDLSKEELEERKVELEKLEILEKMLKENEKKNFKSEEFAETNGVHLRGKNDDNILNLNNTLNNNLNKKSENEGNLEYREAFKEFVLGNVSIPKELRANEHTMTTDINSVIPTNIINRIIEKIETIGMILPLVTKTNYKGGVEIPTAGLKPKATWVAEGMGSAKQKVTTGAISFKYHKLRCEVAITLEANVTSLPVFETWFVNTVAMALTKELESSIVNGDGNGKPNGILLSANIIPEQIVEVDKVTYQTLIDAESALPEAYSNGTKWHMSKKTFLSFIGMVDTNGQPIARVTEGLDKKPLQYLLGREVMTIGEYLDPQKPVIAFMFRLEDYLLNTNYDLKIDGRENWDNEDREMKGVMVVDGAVVDNNSLVVLTKKAPKNSKTNNNE